MKTTDSTLHREFPKVRRAAMADEEVIIVTREGNPRLSAEPRSGVSILGYRKDLIHFSDDRLDEPTHAESEWKPGR
jgi:hypothetical protein